MLRVEEATLADVPQLNELLTILFTQEADFRPDDAKQTVGLRAILEDPSRGKILVMRDGDEVVGMVNLLFTVSTARGGRAALLEDMIVRPTRRGAGAGSALLDAAVAEAKKCGCLRITLLTDKTNEDAMRFYARRGFAPSAMVPLRLGLE